MRRLVLVSIDADSPLDAEKMVALSLEQAGFTDYYVHQTNFKVVVA